ncbi:MAG: hypothetical protein Q9179_002986 [Wetmoreana sp. 5 TL-2023]
MSDASSDQGENPVHDSHVQQLSMAVNGFKAAFCCAGRVPVAQESVFEKIKDDVKDHQLTSPPIVLRWDHQDGKTISKLTLPLKSYESDAEDQVAFNRLLDSCTPASFGKDGKDVLDELYRKAAKLDSDRFLTSFNPYELGIIGAVVQTLLPAGAEHLNEHDLGVVAELYKLNIYSAPSGKFKPHVDTPRGVTQFGSLVVCLPYRHQGGELRVAHGGQETIFSWGDQDTQIEWAAFYSDCEHEVKEVTAGHRVTLTYNLYARCQLGGIFRSLSPVTMDSFFLYHRVKEALASPDFFPEGGTLGFHCTHAYAHTNGSLIRHLPFALKGKDAVIFAVFDRLGLSVKLHGVMEDLRDSYDDENDKLEDDHRGSELVSNGLKGIQLSNLGEQEGLKAIDLSGLQVVPSAWRGKWRKDIEWFGYPGNRELAVVHLAYGNQASLDWHYSTAAILVKIPGEDTEERRKLIS